MKGYERKMEEILNWEEENGEEHKERKTTENEIESVKRRMKVYQDKYKFESLNHLVSFKSF